MPNTARDFAEGNYLDDYQHQAKHRDNDQLCSIDVVHMEVRPVSRDDYAKVLASLLFDVHC